MKMIFNALKYLVVCTAFGHQWRRLGNDTRVCTRCTALESWSPKRHRYVPNHE